MAGRPDADPPKRPAPTRSTSEPPAAWRYSAWTVTGVGLAATAVVAFWVFRIPDLSTTARQGIIACGVLVSLITGLTSAMQRHTVEAATELLAATEHRAHHDRLTGLLNREGVLRRLEMSITEADKHNTALGVLFLDLDRFKMVNDSMGHETGDVLLTLVGERIRDAVRNTDVVARFGGDEFVVICGGLIHEDSVVAVASQILTAFEQPLIIDGGEFVVTPSIGIATTTRGRSRTANDLLRDADAAMYRAKRTRSGYSVFDEAQRQDVMTRMQTERALRSALDSSALEVYYQPIVDANTRSLRELEALVRWDRPGEGLVSPASFLPVAEEAGLMAALGELVLREACAQSVLWNHGALAGGRVGIAVNVAERQLIDKNFPALVAQILHWSGLEPWQLTLEITEDLVIDHLDSSLSVLRDLKRLGVALAIDDFGTGRSSLSYVKRLDMVDGLKIDKSFVHDIGKGQVGHTIIEAIVSMAAALELTIVAEGVETEHQFQYLRDLGVTLMQGYLFQPPMAAHALEDLVQRGARADQATEQARAISALAAPGGASAIRQLARAKLTGSSTSALPELGAAAGSVAVAEADESQG